MFSQKTRLLCKIFDYFRFGKLTSIIPIKIFKSEWSFAQFRIPPDSKAICNFGPDNTINIVTYDGKFYTASFDPVKGGDCEKKQSNSIF